MAYTNIDDPSAHFQTATYTGNAGTLAVVNDGNSDLQPDWVWCKRRDVGANHVLYDSSRGASKVIYSNLADDEETVSGVTAFNTDGFTLGSDGNANASSGSQVAWQWKATGGTTASNSVGNISSTVQANTTAGFSIVTYTGNGSANQTIGHGLGAVPKMILFKNRSSSAYWYVYHVATGNDTMMYLNLTNGAQSLSSQFSTPTTTTFNVSNENSTFSGYNTNSDNYVAYVFADVKGYSKFSSYVGNGNANGPFIYTGFKPAFLMIKDTAAAGNWFITDNKRNTFNLVDDWLVANGSGAETNTLNASSVDYLSNGFKLRTVYSEANTSNRKYSFMAFAENPFVTSTGIPTTAR